MKTTSNTILYGFFIIGIVLLTGCNPKPAGAQPKKETSGTAETDASLPVASQEASQYSTASKTDLEKLGKLGFHIFPEPVDLPQFAVPGLDGTEIKSADFPGKVTLLNFWATWCPPCKQEMPSIQRLHEVMKGTDFRIVAISHAESKKTVQDFISKAKYTFPVYLNERGDLGASFASQGIPTTYILDKTGKLIAGIVGSREYDNPELISILKSIAAQ